MSTTETVAAPANLGAARVVLVTAISLIFGFAAFVASRPKLAPAPAAQAAPPPTIWSDVGLTKSLQPGDLIAAASAGPDAVGLRLVAITNDSFSSPMTRRVVIGREHGRELTPVTLDRRASATFGHRDDTVTLWVKDIPDDRTAVIWISKR